MTGVLNQARRSTPAQIEYANRQQAERRSRGLCILSAGHGSSYRAGRCRSCYERLLRRRVERYVSQRTHARGAEVTGADYGRFRARVMRDMPWRGSGRSRHDYLAKVAREVERRLRLGNWYAVRPANVPPPGWSVEEDRREELIALGELAVMRAVG